MHFRSQRKTAGDVSLSDMIESSKEGNALSFMDVLCSDEDLFEDVSTKEQCRLVRNYVEPKIVGTQLGLHPIITLVSMFIGLRLFGFWGLFGLPVGISFLWKQKKGKESQST